jgi:SAM-dependent methyltransferase
LLTLPQTGHELPERVWDVVVPAILKHTALTWQEEADRLAARALAADDPTGWFDRLYDEAINGGVDMPWDRSEPNPLLAGWVRDRAGDGSDRRAVVVGCGLGADAELLASVGFATTAFDISPAAVGIASGRRPDSAVDYRVSDLLDLPDSLVGAFDLVVDSYTVQALPLSLRSAATAAVRSLVAPGGTLLVIMVARDDAEDPPAGPPWPLNRAEINEFGAGAVADRRIEFLPNAEGRDHWRAEFIRSA